jgi:hypothetical protein
MRHRLWPLQPNRADWSVFVCLFVCAILMSLVLQDVLWNTLQPPVHSPPHHPLGLEREVPTMVMDWLQRGKQAQLAHPRPAALRKASGLLRKQHLALSY